jgi:hypothetical protein
MRAIFALPVVFGLAFLLGSFALFRREALDPRNFAVAIVLSLLVVVSPVVYVVLDAVKDFFGIVYTFVLGFGVAILFLVALVIYLILSIGRLREETDGLWQEVAIMRVEVGHLDGEHDHDLRSED